MDLSLTDAFIVGVGSVVLGANMGRHSSPEPAIPEEEHRQHPIEAPLDPKSLRTPTEAELEMLFQRRSLP
jgi:hypothetical protein